MDTLKATDLLIKMKFRIILGQDFMVSIFLSFISKLSSGYWDK